MSRDVLRKPPGYCATKGPIDIAALFGQLPESGKNRRLVQFEATDVRRRS
jgi:hypothetical protein